MFTTIIILFCQVSLLSLYNALVTPDYMHTLTRWFCRGNHRVGLLIPASVPSLYALWFQDIIITRSILMVVRLGTKIRIGLVCLLVSVVGYYTYVVVKARIETPDMMATLLTPGRLTLHASDLTPERREILLKVQDPGFYSHNGVDLFTPGTGLTTITQSLAKIYYFDGSFSPGLGKIKQTLIAWLVINPLVKKDDQITLFINDVYVGQDGEREIIGFENAALFYWGRHFTQLGDDEYLALVAMLRAPNEYDPRNHPEQSRGRVGRIKRVLSGSYKPQSNGDIWYDENE